MGKELLGTKTEITMKSLRVISYRNPFFYKNNRFSREIHTYSETDYIEKYKGFSIWKHETNCRNDGSRRFDIVKDGVVVETCGGSITNILGVRFFIDKLINS
jgi:hypothetical protein